jgi:hypothetical protein
LNHLSSTRSSVPEAAEQNRINFNPPDWITTLWRWKCTCSQKKTYNGRTGCSELKEEEGQQRHILQCCY